ncbi:hypothetical protein HRbin08_02292 [bacterium HR08]|nr:hypothetical protein HRbin08_02292 [bacterium HR08]
MRLTSSQIVPCDTQRTEDFDLRIFHLRIRSVALFDFGDGMQPSHLQLPDGAIGELDDADPMVIFWERASRSGRHPSHTDGWSGNEVEDQVGPVSAPDDQWRTGSEHLQDAAIALGIGHHPRLIECAQANHHRGSDRPLGDPALECSNAGIEAEDKADLKFSPRGFSGFQHAAPHLARDRDGLFAEDMFAGLQARDRDLRSDLRRGSDDDGFDLGVLDPLAIIAGHPLDPELFDGAREGRLVYVGHGSEDDARVALHGRKVKSARHSATADHTDADLLSPHGSPNRGRTSRSRS